MTVLSMLSLGPDTLGVLALLLAATLVLTVAVTHRRCLATFSTVGARAVGRHHVGGVLAPPRSADPDAAGRSRPRAPSLG